MIAGSGWRREMGDLRENGEYIAGREQQGFLMGRIRELNGMLSRSDIIDCTRSKPIGPHLARW